MIIANPIYDVVFKYLMEDADIAKGIISRIIQEDIESLQFSTQEQVVPRDYTVWALFRLDFVAQIRMPDGSHRKVLIEIQKAKLSADVSRFRTYLGKQYMRKDEVIDIDGSSRRASLPIITIYILGFTLSENMPASIKVRREYLDALTGAAIPGRDDFIEALTHDAYVIQVPRLHAGMQNDLERVLSVFEQAHFVDDAQHEIDYAHEPGRDDLLASIIRRLHKGRVEEEVRVRMDLEDQLYEETVAAVEARTSSLTQKLKIKDAELSEVRISEQEAKAREAEAKAREEEAKAREEEAKAREEEAKAHAIRTMAERLGISEQEARAILRF